MLPITHNEAKKSKLLNIFTTDEYRGITCAELDWKKDTIFIQGALFDGLDSIEQFMEKYECFSTLLEAAAYFTINVD